MTETTIWDIDEHRGEPPAIRRLALQEAMRYLASYLNGDNILEPRTVARSTAATRSSCGPSREST